MNMSLNAYYDQLDESELRGEKYEAWADEKQRVGDFKEIAEKHAAESLITLEPWDPHGLIGDLIFACPDECARALIVLAGRRDLLPKHYADNLEMIDRAKAEKALQDFLDAQEKQARAEYIEKQIEHHG